jgi:phospho-N-acetylmuramoyl-pentapeptide-transferase
MIVFLATLITTLFFYFLPNFCSNFWCQQLNFLSRSQVVLPLFTLIVGGLLGFVDDFFQISGKGKYIAGGLTFKQRLLVILLVGLVGGWWFCFKLGWTVIGVPFLGDFDIGLFYFPLFIAALLSVWSGGIIDGIDGLAGGVFMIIFSAYGAIAFAQHQYDLAAFCAIITASLLPFLWHNIPPAKFYMGETGTIALTTTLTVVAFLTNAVVVLPIIAGLLLFESLSVILQLISKKIRKKKIWLCTPIHHHFEATGWAPFQVTMRFWIIGAILAIIGVIIQLTGKL